MQRFFRPALLLPIAAVLGCGSSPAPAKPKAVEQPAVIVPQPPLAAPPRLPDAPALPSNPITKPANLPDAPPVSKDIGKPDTNPASSAKRKLDEFDPEVVGGRPIGQWMEMLNSEKKDDIIEAAEALKMVPTKAKKALPRLEDLTKNADKEISQEAKDTIKAISGK
jgi:hypothetical protein